MGEEAETGINMTRGRKFSQRRAGRLSRGGEWGLGGRGGGGGGG